MDLRTHQSINDDDHDRMPNFLVLLSFSQNIGDNTALSGTCSVANGSCSLAFTYTYCLARSRTRTNVYGMALENNSNSSWNTDSVKPNGKGPDLEQSSSLAMQTRRSFDPWCCGRPNRNPEYRPSRTFYVSRARCINAGENQHHSGPRTLCGRSCGHHS